VPYEPAHAPRAFSGPSPQDLPRIPRHLATDNPLTPELAPSPSTRTSINTRHAFFPRPPAGRRAQRFFPARTRGRLVSAPSSDSAFPVLRRPPSTPRGVVFSSLHSPARPARTREMIISHRPNLASRFRDLARVVNHDRFASWLKKIRHVRVASCGSSPPVRALGTFVLSFLLSDRLPRGGGEPPLNCFSGSASCRRLSSRFAIAPGKHSCSQPLYRSWFPFGGHDCG